LAFEQDGTSERDDEASRLGSDARGELSKRRECGGFTFFGFALGLLRALQLTVLLFGIEPRLLRFGLRPRFTLGEPRFLSLLEGNELALELHFVREGDGSLSLPVGHEA
jgi:hypothetical protein